MKNAGHDLGYQIIKGLMKKKRWLKGKEEEYNQYQPRRRMRRICDYEDKRASFVTFVVKAIEFFLLEFRSSITFPE